MTECQLIINKEFTADNEKQNDTDKNIGERLIQSEGSGNLRCTPVKENNNKRGQNHHNRIELSKPGYKNSSKSSSACCFG